MRDAERFQILLVDDDLEIHSALTDALANDYALEHAHNGDEAMRFIQGKAPDLVVLDVNMPVKDGIWTCQELRNSAATKHIPILVLSARKEVEQKLEAYSVGADDYLEKPFTVAELKAKIQVKMRRLEEKKPREITRGNLKLHVSRMEAEIGTQRIPLSVLESRLLAYFLMNPDTVLPRNQILTDVWKSVNVSDRTVDAHIVGLRRKISDFEEEIVTVYGAGYSLRPKAEKFHKSRSSS